MRRALVGNPLVHFLVGLSRDLVAALRHGAGRLQDPVLLRVDPVVHDLLESLHRRLDRLPAQHDLALRREVVARTEQQVVRIEHERDLPRPALPVLDDVHPHRPEDLCERQLAAAPRVRLLARLALHEPLPHQHVVLVAERELRRRRCLPVLRDLVVLVHHKDRLRRAGDLA